MTDLVRPVRVCTRCGEPKPLSEFYRKHAKAPSRSVNVRSECKACSNELAIARQAQRRAEIGVARAST
jgi:hypothetical protein